MRSRLLFMLVILVLAAVPAAAQEANAAACIERFDPDADYFPAKADIQYADGFTIEYFGSYKVVTVTRPYLGAPESDVFRYVLVQCGTPAPDGFDGLPVIEVPIDAAITLSTTQLPHFTTLGILDALVGVDSGFYVSTPEVLEKYEAGELAEVGFGTDVNVEVAIDSGADIAFGYASGVPDYDAYPKLEEAGLQTAINAEYAEVGPLARAEWIKFTAAFFNREAEAEAYFDAVAEEYESLKALTAGLSEDERPDVLWNSFSSFIEAWAIPGAQTYVGVILNDAGADVVLGEDAPESSVNLPFERVYEAGLDADIWIPVVFGVGTLDELAATDERYADFAAFQSGEVYNTDGRVNANGGNDYFENGVNEPHVVLADLISIFHPDLLPDHELVYLRKLE
jgi:iron complex transport system substrate-binding protein